MLNVYRPLVRQYHDCFTSERLSRDERNLIAVSILHSTCLKALLCRWNDNYRIILMFFLDRFIFFWEIVTHPHSNLALPIVRDNTPTHRRRNKKCNLIIIVYCRKGYLNIKYYIHLWKKQISNKINKEW